MIHQADLHFSNTGIQELNFDEVDLIGGASEWGDNVLLYGGVGMAIGSLGGPKGAAAGGVIGAVVGTAVTIFY